MAPAAQAAAAPGAASAWAAPTPAATAPAPAGTPPAREAPAPGPADSTAPEPGPGQWFIEDYGIDELWPQTTGEGVTVAVIDSGVEDDHENLSDRVAGARDFSQSGTDGKTPIGPTETIHHGTAVAGVIAGSGEGAGPVGVAPDAAILSASMWLGTGLPDGAPSSREQAAEAIRWAADNGADVINMSLGWDDPSWPEAWDEAFAYAYSKDAVIVACVGNSSQGADQAWSPSTVPGVVGVGGLAEDGGVRTESTAPGIAVDLMGPAENIPVPFHTGGYAQAQGCSFAAPVVSGIVALLRSAQPELTADEVVAKLHSTATEVPGHDGRSSPGKPDPIVGWGRVQPGEALRAEVPADVPSASAALSQWVDMHRRADVEDPEGASDAETSQAALTEESKPGAAVDRTSVDPTGPIVLAGGGAAAALLVVLGLRSARRTAVQQRRSAAQEQGDSAGQE
ncbi:hypothetical protein GCM10022261_25810 [Brevibacterium daeguense]|uniref:Peptidase S8/S53 domain-containing protein n=1 Tax=Brevibacterium daeguense TaxID=909936 RepID=A0ABP8EM33_9MICO